MSQITVSYRKIRSLLIDKRIDKEVVLLEPSCVNQDCRIRSKLSSSYCVQLPISLCRVRKAELTVSAENDQCASVTAFKRSATVCVTLSRCIDCMH